MLLSSKSQTRNSYYICVLYSYYEVHIYFLCTNLSENFKTKTMQCKFVSSSHAFCGSEVCLTPQSFQYAK